MFENMHDWLASHLPIHLATAATHAARLAFIGVLAWAAQVAARRLILRGVEKLVQRSKNRWDDALSDHGAFRRISHLAPALVLYQVAPVIFSGLATTSSIIRGLASIYMIVVLCRIADALVSAALQIYESLAIARERPLKSFAQVVKIIIYFAGAIFIVAVLRNESPAYIFAGLGTLTAVLMLVFKDSILGLTAGIQVIANDLVRPGDWIEMPRYGADGDVIDISLTAVKVRNWDKTVTSLPTYALVSESFKNWRGMTESGGRRIKRSMHIDLSSVRFCDDDMLERFSRMSLIQDYVQERSADVSSTNRAEGVDTSEPINGRRLTNLGTFRAYIEAYLRNHPKIHDDMTFLVRQLAPSPEGIPIEIYVFSNDQVWTQYEALQADIFDHMIAAIPRFDLRIFQHPTGYDLRSIDLQRDTDSLSH